MMPVSSSNLNNSMFRKRWFSTYRVPRVFDRFESSMLVLQGIYVRDFGAREYNHLLKKMKRILCLLSVFAFAYIIIAQVVGGSITSRDDTSPLMLPEPFLDLGSGGSYAIFVSKSDSRIDVYEKLSDSSIVRVRSFRTSTGQVEGDKSEEGDLKTPEGIYYLVRIREQKELSRKYGIRAFDLNYPNLFDLLEAKTGHGIWLHGTDEPDRLNEPRTSEGCIVVHNEDIKALSEYITLYRTPIVIADKFTYQNPPAQTELRDTIKSTILDWLNSWATQDFERFRDHYSNSFRNKNRGLKAWLARKRNVFSQTAKASIDIADLKILKDGDYFLASFIQRYRSNLMDDTGIKWVYLQNEGRELKIIGEEWYPISKAVKGYHWNTDLKFSNVVHDLAEVDLNREGKVAIVDPQYSLPWNTGMTAAVQPKEEIADLNSSKKTGTQASSEAESKEREGDSADYPVSVDKFEIVGRENNEISVHFKLINKSQDNVKQSGWLFLVANWSGEDEYTSFPQATMESGRPVSASEGDIYGIRWFKEVSASLRRPSRQAELLEIRCYLFDRQGKLLKNFRIHNGN